MTNIKITFDEEELKRFCINHTTSAVVISALPQPGHFEAEFNHRAYDPDIAYDPAFTVTWIKDEVVEEVQLATKDDMLTINEITKSESDSLEKANEFSKIK